MKRIFSLFAFLLLANAAIAQNASKAKQFLKEKNFDKAIEAINLATNDPKQSTKAETWYVRADIYLSMLESAEADIRTKEPKALDFINESTAKVQELEKGKGTYTKLIETSIPGVSFSVKDRLYSSLFNAAVASQSEPEVAFGYFEKLTEMFPDDMTSNRYGTRFAYAAEKYDVAIAMAKKFVANPKFADSTHIVSEIYQYGIMCAERAEKKEETNALIEAAMAKFPKEPFFLNRKINALIGDKKYEDAVNYLKAGLELAKDDAAKAMYMVNLGMLCQDLKKADEANKYFEETLKLDPKNFTANFSLGALHYNKGAELANTLGVNELEKTSPKMKQVIAHYQAAMPYLEAAHKIDESKNQVYNPLYIIYKEVYGESNEKTKAIRAKMLALMGNDDDDK